MVREIYSLKKTLTKNFEVNSTNVTESNERTNIRTDEHHGENCINAGGIKISLLRPLKIKTTSVIRLIFASPKRYISYDIIFNIMSTSLIRPLFGSLGSVVQN